MKKLLHELRPDVIHTHQIGALFYAGPPARRAGARVVVHTEHGKHYAARRRTRWLGRWAGRYAARFFCVSRDIAEEVAACRIVPQAKIEVVANGIDTAAFAVDDDPLVLRRALDIPEHAPVIGTVGRLNEIKRQDLLLSAVAQIPDTHLLLVGDGPRLQALRDLAGKLKIEGRVHFAGYQSRPEAYLRTMDVFALTSRSEGMPLAVLEAWATGLPVVASRVGGLPDLIEEGRTGLLFAPDDENSLVLALSSLLDDKQQARQLGNAGREQVRSTYSLERMAMEYERHYRELHRAALGISGLGSLRRIHSSGDQVAQ
jgi:glycosyltransferase involved in cell wall biosynthesis